MIPRKLNRGDKFSALFELWNALIDYLYRIRAVSGPGILISKTAAGTLFSVQYQPRVGTSAGGSESAAPTVLHGSFLVTVPPPRSAESANHGEQNTAEGAPSGQENGSSEDQNATEGTPPEKLNISQGFANVNGRMFDIAATGIDIKELEPGEHYLCVEASVPETGDIAPPGFAFHAVDPEHYPIAWVEKKQTGFVTIKQYPVSVATFMLVKKCLYAQAVN